MPNLPLVILPHPLGGLKADEVVEKAKIAIEEIVKILS
jgi:hypothetical protein